MTDYQTELLRAASLSTRRRFLTRGAQATAGLTLLGGLAAACGGSSSGSSAPTSAASGPISGDIVWMNYPGWIAKNLIPNFTAKYPDVTVKQVSGDLNGDVQAAGQVIQNQSSYDMAFLTVASIGQCVEAGVLQKPNFANIPNIKNVDPTFTAGFPWGFPQDYGKIGYAYRQDLISERPTSWKDFFDLTPKYSGKVVLAGYDRDVLGSMLLSMGQDPNTTDPNTIKTATNNLINLKPHIMDFPETNIGKSLAQGDAVMTLDWDSDMAGNITANPDIVWVNPSEGMTTYLEGWVPVKGTKNEAAVEAFMNFAMEPKQYADFVNTVSSAYTIPSATPYVDKWVVQSPALKKPTGIKLYFEKYLGSDGTKLMADSWEQIQSA